MQEPGKINYILFLIHLGRDSPNILSSLDRVYPVLQGIKYSLIYSLSPTDARLKEHLSHVVFCLGKYSYDLQCLFPPAQTFIARTQFRTSTQLYPRYFLHGPLRQIFVEWTPTWMLPWKLRYYSFQVKGQLLSIILTTLTSFCLILYSCHTQ